MQHSDPQLFVHRTKRTGADLARLARRRRQRTEPAVELRGHLGTYIWIYRVAASIHRVYTGSRTHWPDEYIGLQPSQASI